MRKNSVRNIAFAGVVLALFFKTGLAGAAVITFDATAPTYSMSLGAVDIKIVGQEFFANPSTGAAQGTMGGGLSVTWDASILHLTAVNRLFAGDNFFASDGSITTTNGISTLAGLSVSSFFNGTGAPSFDIARLRFSFLRPGTSSIALSVSDLDVWADGAGLVDVKPNALTRTITVSGVPLPSALLLFGSSLFGMVSISRRRSAAA